MALEIIDTQMTLTLNGEPIADAVLDGDAWHVSTWPSPLSLNQAITALTLAEWIATGHSEHDSFAVAWREELNT